MENLSLRFIRCGLGCAIFMIVVLRSTEYATVRTSAEAIAT